MNPQEYQQNLAAMRCGLAISDAAATATGGIFLMSQLSALDPTLRLPLENFTWFRDIPKNTKVKGWVTSEIARNVDFRAQQSNPTGADSNDILVVNYNINQDVWPVYPWAMRLRVPVVESLRMAAANESPQKLLDDGIRIHYSKTLDIRTYQGFNGKYGLTNNPAVTQVALPATGTSSSMTWASKTPAQILADFNFMAYTNWQASGAAPGAIPDRFLVPSVAWEQLTQLMTLGGVGGGESVLQYIKRSYFGSAFGVTPEIYPLPSWLDAAGTAIGSPAVATGLVVAYKFSEDCLSLSVPMELQRMAAPLSIISGCYEVLYIANIGVVKINRPQTVGLYYGCQ